MAGRKKPNARSEAAKRAWQARREAEKAGEMEQQSSTRDEALAQEIQERLAAQTAGLQPYEDAEAAGLAAHRALSDPDLQPPRPEDAVPKGLQRPALDPEVMAARLLEERRGTRRAPAPPPLPPPVSSPEREGNRLAEQMKRDQFRTMIEADEREHGPQGRNPRVPMTAVPQAFRRRRSFADPPPLSNGKSPVPEGTIPTWVTTESTAGIEAKPSMATIHDYQDYGYRYVCGDDGKPIVTSLGVLMCASPEDWAKRKLDKAPTGAFSRRDLSESLHETQREINRSAGRPVATITEHAEHRRTYEREVVHDPDR